jgi:two-component system, NarL family, invasion response regulator UvrY
MIRVLMADDHPIVRRGLRQILSEHGEMAVDEVSTIPELRGYLGKNCPDVLVLDVNMPGGSGLEMIGEVRSLYPRLPILVLSVHPEEQAGVRAMLAGAQGYLNKDSAPESLVDAVTRLKAGGKFISAELGEALANYLQRPDDARLPHELLSEREFTVMKKLAVGQSTGDIAVELNLSPKTVSTYRTRILEKMGMASNADLTRYLIEHGLGETNSG